MGPRHRSAPAEQRVSGRAPDLRVAERWRGAGSYDVFFDDYKRVDGAFGENARQTATILDGNGRVVAGIVERRTTRHLIGDDICDYTLTFDHSPREPRGSQCLVVALADYFHGRSDDG